MEGLYPSILSLIVLFYDQILHLKYLTMCICVCLCVFMVTSVPVDVLILVPLELGLQAAA